MTREEKKAVTALRRSLPTPVRPLIKPYRYKSIDGAFALYEVPVYERRRPLETLEGELVAAHIRDALAEFSGFLASVRGREMDWFRSLEAGQERYANMEVMRLMLMLHDGRRDEALAYVTAHDVSAYIVGRKTVGQLVAQYCL